jgi:hypothetical protein
VLLGGGVSLGVGVIDGFLVGCRSAGGRFTARVERNASFTPTRRAISGT